MTVREGWAACRADWRANRDVKSRLALLSLRAACVFEWRKRSQPLVWAIGLPFMVWHRVAVEWVLGIELSAKTEVGPGLRLYHGQGLVVHHQSKIGANVALRQNTTIGERKAGESGSPVLKDGVDVGANVVIIGPVVIGEDAVIGAGAVVISDVPPGCVAVGNPARVIRQGSTERRSA